MPQGKLRTKAKLPANAAKKAKSKRSTVSRKSRPITPKKTKSQEVQKIKKVITKNVNEALEEELRARANDSKKLKLSSKKKTGKSAEKAKK